MGPWKRALGTAREIELVTKQCHHLRVIDKSSKMDISEFDDAYAQYVVECTEQGLEWTNVLESTRTFVKRYASWKRRQCKRRL